MLVEATSKKSSPLHQAFIQSTMFDGKAFEKTLDVELDTPFTLSWLLASQAIVGT